MSTCLCLYTLGNLPEGQRGREAIFPIVHGGAEVQADLIPQGDPGLTSSLVGENPVF